MYVLLNVFLDACRQTPMYPSLLRYHHEFIEHGNRQCTGGRRFRACDGFRGDSREPSQPLIHQAVCEHILRDTVERGGILLLDAVLCCDRVHQDIEGGTHG